MNNFHSLLVKSLLLVGLFWGLSGIASGQIAALVKDINDNGSSFPHFVPNVDGKFFFSANDGNSGTELWTSDGTDAGTVQVADLVPGPASSSPGVFTNVNETYFFSARTDGMSDQELWKTDGTEAGTVLVRDINPGPSASGPFNFTNLNGMLLFTASDGSTGHELWKSDGTTAGTVLVLDIAPGSNSSGAQSFLNVNGTLFFRANDGSNGTELWRSDGTAAGTMLVADIAPGAASSNPLHLTNLNGTLYFSVDDGISGRELWRSDGTAAGTMLVADIAPNELGSNISRLNGDSLTVVNGTLFFTADDGTTGRELWKSDGTAAGTLLVKDIRPGGIGSGPFSHAFVNGTHFFTANDGATGRELWKSDGTAAGTLLVKDIRPGSGGSNLFPLVNFNGTLYMSANDGSSGQELWTSDGTATGTVLVQDIAPGLASALDTEGANIAVVGTYMFFQANDGLTGNELWALNSVTDSDGDGIVDALDGDPSNPSILSFSDVGLGGTTFGEITNPGDQILTITEETNPTGVRIAAALAGGNAPAHIKVCGGTGNIQVRPGDEVIVTCSSITLTVIHGDGVSLQVIVDNEPVTIIIGAGNSVTFDPLDNDSITASATNTSSLIIEVNGRQIVVSPGERVLVDTTAPMIEEVSATPNVLWPPNHKMVTVFVQVTVSDNLDPAPTCEIVSVISSEPVNGEGDGNTTPDWEITGDLTLNLRAERAGGGIGRVYTITVECRDTSGNASTRTVRVTVPHDQKGKPKKKK